MVLWAKMEKREAVQKDSQPARSGEPLERIKQCLAARLSKIEGQLRGVKGMIESDAHCDDVLTQIAAIEAALHAVGRLLLEAHIRGCVVERLREGDTAVIDELMGTVKRLI